GAAAAGGRLGPLDRLDAPPRRRRLRYLRRGGAGPRPGRDEPEDQSGPGDLRRRRDEPGRPAPRPTGSLDAASRATRPALAPRRAIDRRAGLLGAIGARLGPR